MKLKDPLAASEEDVLKKAHEACFGRYFHRGKGKVLK